MPRCQVCLKFTVLPTPWFYVLDTAPPEGPELGGNQEEKEIKQLELLELELIQTQMAQKPMLRAEVGMRVRCANKASAE